MLKQFLPGADEAETIALKALVFLVRDETRLKAFIETTGIDPDTLRSHAGSRHLQTAILDHLLADESLLLIFVEEEGLDPDMPRLARMRLGGEDV